MSKKSYADHLVWLDLESAGTDEAYDPILEVGIAVTQPTFPFDERDRFSSIVVPVRPDDSWIDDLDPIVLEMHTRNGLLDEIKTARVGGEYLLPYQIQQNILDFLAPYGKRLLLAGSGVGHFDRRFIRAQMPRLDERLMFPCLDVGIIRRTMALLGRNDLLSHDGGANDLKPHRALDDALIHLDEYRHYCKMFLDMPDFRLCLSCAENEGTTAAPAVNFGPSIGRWCEDCIAEWDAGIRGQGLDSEPK